MMTKWDVPWFLAVVACLVLGALIGAWHGFWVAYVGIPAFIVTLSSMLLFRGLTLVVLEGATVGGLPEAFEDIGNGFLPEIGPDTDLHNLTMVLGALVVALYAFLEWRKRAASRRYNVEVLPFPLFALKLVVIGAVIMEFTYLLADARGLPIVGLILFALIAIYTFVMQRTVLGRHVYAIGGNVDAATMSGVNTKRVDFLVMTNMGFLAGLAGMVTTARLTAANPKAGVNFELDAIAAAFIGGAAVTGGVGTVIGAIIGGRGHGCPQQRHVPHERLDRLAAGDQGPGAPGGGGVRRVEQEAHRRRRWCRCGGGDGATTRRAGRGARRGSSTSGDTTQTAGRVRPERGPAVDPTLESVGDTS